LKVEGWKKLAGEYGIESNPDLCVKEGRKIMIKDRKKNPCTRPQGPSPLGQGIRMTPI